MAWMMANPQIHNTFASLGVQHGDIYIVNKDCLEILEEILRNLIIEDRTLRTYRRAIGFGENIRKDLIPLLIHVKNNTKIEDATKIIDVTIKILLNLTIPVECLLSLEQESRTDVGRHTIFELNRLLLTSKEAFTDSRSTKAVVEHIKYVVEKDTALNIDQCNSINNCLLLLRNILHIPEHRLSISSCPLAHSSMQNQIIWNLFTQSIDKIMIYLMSCSQKVYWSVTMVQLIALMYKDQYVGTLQKLLSLWFEASLSESSEDNESNTSPQNQGSGESSPTMMSDPTSDSSDNGSGGNRINNDRSKGSANKIIACVERNRNNTEDVCNRAAEVVRAAQSRSKVLTGIKRGKSTETDISTNSSNTQSTDSGISSKMESSQPQTSLTSLREKPEQMSGIMKQEVVSKTTKKYICRSSQSEFSDYGYVTQVENRGESISTSSNDDDQPHQKPVHQKPFQKIRYSHLKNKAATILEKKELRRKKLVKRSKTNMLNMKGLMHHMPTDEDITNVLKEFTVDFLLKAYGTLVHDLHSQFLTNIQLSVDTSHFFWLVTYFLKFAAQLELDLELISAVLSYNIISYLVFQGVWLYEELEIGCGLTETDLKPSLRRLHLVVTAIREFVQALETYQKIAHLNEEDRNSLTNLQLQISEMDELKNLFLLLLRQYNPNMQSRQYLEDLIVTNHSYLLLLDKISQNLNLELNIMDHLKEFATPEIMCQYGILLEEFQENGEFVNNCIFTMMHHTAGDLGNIATLFLPNILKTFSQIWETDYELCDDWSDLIEYVIHRFINISKSNQQIYSTVTLATPIVNHDGGNLSTPGVASQVSVENEWTQEEKFLPDTFQDMENAISNVMRSHDENCTNKNQNKLIKQILEQNAIDQKDLKNIPMEDSDENCKMGSSKLNQESSINGDIKVLKEHLIKEKKQNIILWLQKVLIEACYAKLAVENLSISHWKRNTLSPIAYYYSLLNLSIPFVPWTSEQCNIMKHQPFVLLLHKFGFILPADVRKIFIRIPNFWSANYLFSIAEQLGPIDTEKLKLDLHLLLGTETTAVNSESDTIKSGFVRNCNFLTTRMKSTPLVVRYTPHPNSMEWFSSVLQSKITPLIDSMLNILNTNELSISIPETQAILYNVPPPELSIAQSPQETNTVQQEAEMDCSSVLQGVDETEHISICETASVASDLTRMCVSDEEEKLEEKRQ